LKTIQAGNVVYLSERNKAAEYCIDQRWSKRAKVQVKKGRLQNTENGNERSMEQTMDGKHWQTDNGIYEN